MDRGVDPGPTPWRVLEDPIEPAPEPQETGRSRAAAIPRSALIMGGVAVLLAVSAFALAFGTASSGAVTVDGGASFGTSALATVGPGGSFDTSGTGTPGRLVVVEVEGAVDHPGVFRLPAGSRVGDLVTAAGGYGPRVDADRAGRELNLAQPLRDGEQIRVPSRDEATDSTTRPVGAVPAQSPAARSPVDLNTATAAELDALPGIGPVTAAKILASRDQQPFREAADLRVRKLVGEKTFAVLKDLVAVR